MNKNILLFLKGIAMGASDVVPGVSGGTIAFITGIYQRFIFAIKNINISNIKLFFTGNFKTFWSNIDGTFLSILFAGIATSFLSLAKIITYLLVAQPIFIWSFFFGLILASTLFIGKDVKWKWSTIAIFIGFTILSYYVTHPGNTPISTNNSLPYIFLCGAIAICAMILPGISGSFILLLLGEYEYVLTAVTQLNFVVILTFLCGAIVGIISFSHVLNWLFENHKNWTLAALTGFMFGSINKIWPWKETITTYIDRHGIEKALSQQNILPEINASFNIAISLIFVGFILIYVIEYIAKKSN